MSEVTSSTIQYKLHAKKNLHEKYNIIRVNVYVFKERLAVNFTFLLMFALYIWMHHRLNKVFSLHLDIAWWYIRSQHNFFIFCIYDEAFICYTHPVFLCKKNYNNNNLIMFLVKINWPILIITSKKNPTSLFFGLIIIYTTKIQIF